MDRIVEPELMYEEAQVLAYAEANFSEPHEAFVERFSRHFPDLRSDKPYRCLDLGCGPCDVTVRMAKRFPQMTFTGLDGSAPMLKAGEVRLKKEGLQDRVELLECRLPAVIAGSPFDIIISNSLMHHLHQPEILFQTIKEAGGFGCRVMIMDLMRADSPEVAMKMTQQYCGDEPEVLRRDFYNSLLAALTVDEVFQMIKDHKLHGLRVKATSDRHMVIHGCL